MKTRVYEGLFLISNQEANKDLDAVQRTIRELLEKHNAQVHVINRWDERKLAYEIHGMRRGTYVLCYFSAPTGAITPIDAALQLTDAVVRHLIVQDAPEVLPRHKMTHTPEEYKPAEPPKSRAHSDAAPADAPRARDFSGSRDQ